MEDLNASTRMRANDASCDNDQSVFLLGPHGNSKKECNRGTNHLDDELGTAYTFYASNKGHDTWIHAASKEKHQLDHFLINQRHLQLVMDVKRKGEGVPSHCAALCNKLKFPNTK